MAKNWKVAEAIKAIQAGNKEDIIDIGRRFPLFAVAAAQVNVAGLAILECLPDYCTARKIESMMKGEIQETDGDDDGSADEHDIEDKKGAKPEKPAKEVKADKPVANPYEGKSAKELYDMCKKAKIDVEPKQKPEVYIKALEKAAKAAAKPAKPAKDADDDWGDDDTTKPEKPAKPAKPEKPAKPAKDDDDWDL